MVRAGVPGGMRRGNWSATLQSPPQDRQGSAAPVNPIEAEVRHTSLMQPRTKHSARNNRQWGPAASRDEAARRASGRARYNKRRQVKAAIRRRRIVEIWEQKSREGWSIFSRGSQSQLAGMLGVNRSTICRDLRVIWARSQVIQCPTCDSALRIGRAEDLESLGRVKITRRS